MEVPDFLLSPTKAIYAQIWGIPKFHQDILVAAADGTQAFSQWRHWLNA